VFGASVYPVGWRAANALIYDARYYNYALSASQVSTIGVLPVAGTVTVAVSAGKVSLAWPLADTGWTLEVQTNALNAGLGSNWTRISSSTTTNQMIMPISPANSAVFYRLVYP